MDNIPENSVFSLKTTTSINDIPSEQWNRLNAAGHPFVMHEFLAALEDSNCVGRDTGWDIVHLCVYDEEHNLRGVMPHYLKYHSYGEYIFDHSWANAYERSGQTYYPKSLSAVPFTPVPGPRLLTLESDIQAKQALFASMQALIENNNLSSAHINFIDIDDLTAARDNSWMIREGLQFHWHNQDYESFDHFLEFLTSRKRKNIRKERDSIQESGIRFEHLTGDTIKPIHWNIFYQCYLATIEKKWGGAYLTGKFFQSLSGSIAEKILLILAYDGDTPIAGALNFIGPDALYGRNWGGLRNVPFLHFETCYYQAIDFAIKMGLKRVEAGAQGLHKVPRGYLPSKTYSAHKILNPQFEEAVMRFLRQEALQNQEEALLIAKTSPYK
ncbi:MAG: GNAT family N-acetyltransferase [Alphaproteobacteria bacterium]